MIVMYDFKVGLDLDSIRVSAPLTECCPRSEDNGRLQLLCGCDVSGPAGGVMCSESEQQMLRPKCSLQRRHTHSDKRKVRTFFIGFGELPILDISLLKDSR